MELDVTGEDWGRKKTFFDLLFRNRFLFGEIWGRMSKYEGEWEGKNMSIILWNIYKNAMLKTLKTTKV